MNATAAAALLQANVPPVLAQKVKDIAEQEGITIAAFVRRAIAKAAGVTVLQAWWRGPGDADTALGHALAGRRPTFLLETIAASVDGSIDVRVMNDEGRPIRDHAFFGAYSFSDEGELRGGRMLIAGSLLPWRVVWSLGVALSTSPAADRFMCLRLIQDPGA